MAVKKNKHGGRLPWQRASYAVAPREGERSGNALYTLNVTDEQTQFIYLNCKT